MIKASFSEDGQFYQYKDKEEYDHIIKRLFNLMKCENEQGIADFLRIELSEVVSAGNNNIIPTDWFKRYYFVIYTMVDEIKNGKNITINISLIWNMKNICLISVLIL